MIPDYLFTTTNFMSRVNFTLLFLYIYIEKTRNLIYTHFEKVELWEKRKILFWQFQQLLL